MYNTLDSIEHVVACLEQKYKDRVISVSPYLTRDFTEMAISYDVGNNSWNVNKNKLYFGVLTVGNLDYWNEVSGGIVNVVLFEDYIADTDMPNHVVVAPNSQIVELFEGISFGAGGLVNLPDSGTYNDIGQFRGFEINII